MQATPVKPRVLLVVGLPRSGKTHVALNLREAGFDHIQRHSASDTASLAAAVQSSLKASRDVVVDSANLTKDERLMWISSAQQSCPSLSILTVVCGMTPTGDDAASIEPAHLQYREQYMSKAATADMDDEEARARVHEVIRMLDNSFDVPSTTEGIEVLTHVRTEEDLEQVLTWLGPAVQQAAIDQVNGQKPLGWSTPPPASAKAAADAWMQARSSQPSPQPSKAAQPKPASNTMSQLPPPLPWAKQNGQDASHLSSGSGQGFQATPDQSSPVGTGDTGQKVDSPTGPYVQATTGRMEPSTAPDLQPAAAYSQHPYTLPSTQHLSGPTPGQYQGYTHQQQPNSAMQQPQPAVQAQGMHSRHKAGVMQGSGGYAAASATEAGPHGPQSAPGPPGLGGNSGGYNVRQPASASAASLYSHQGAPPAAHHGGGAAAAGTRMPSESTLTGGMGAGGGPQGGPPGLGGQQYPSQVPGAVGGQHTAMPHQPQPQAVQSYSQQPQADLGMHGSGYGVPGGQPQAQYMHGAQAPPQQQQPQPQNPYLAQQPDAPQHAQHQHGQQSAQYAQQVLAQPTGHGMHPAGQREQREQPYSEYPGSANLGAAGPQGRGGGPGGAGQYGGGPPQQAPQNLQQPQMQQPPPAQQSAMQQPHMQHPHMQQPHMQHPHMQHPHMQQPPMQQQPHMQQQPMQQRPLQQPPMQQPPMQQPQPMQQGLPQQMQNYSGAVGMDSGQHGPPPGAPPHEPRPQVFGGTPGGPFPAAPPGGRMHMRSSHHSMMAPEPQPAPQPAMRQGGPMHVHDPPARAPVPGRSGGGRGPYGGMQAPPHPSGPGMRSGPGLVRGGPRDVGGAGKRSRPEADGAWVKRQNTGPGGSGGGGGGGGSNGAAQAPRPAREAPVAALQPVNLGTSDPRPLLLFEVSGVLCNSTSARMATNAKNFLPRPGVRHLARLLPKFRLGIYTSAQERSVMTALGVVTSALRGELATWHDGWQMLIDGKNPAAAPGEATRWEAGGDGAQAVKDEKPEIKVEEDDEKDEEIPELLVEVPPRCKSLPRHGLRQAELESDVSWQRVFDPTLLLSRKHCREGHKVPEVLFPEAHGRVLMVNDSPAAGTDAALHVACWEAANRSDAQLGALADALLDHLPDNFLEPAVDLRAITTRVNGAVKAARDEPLPKLTPTESEDGYYESYPVRPGAEACQFFQQCGYCKFLGDCVKTHPLEQRVKLNRGGFPLRPGKQECPSYLRTAFCPLMKACMMHHPNLRFEAAAADAPVDTSAADEEKQKRGKTFEHDRMEVVEEGDWAADYPQNPKKAVCETFRRFGGCEAGASCPLHHPLEEGIVLNNYGLPMRAKAVWCDFFTRTGICKFGRNCRKHHPHLKPGPPIRKAPFRAPRLLQMPPESPYFLVDEVTGSFPEFPQNPGKPPCPHFVRTGHCGYGGRCPHHHPVQYSVKRNVDGLPLRPGKELCKFYVVKRACAYGQACVLHHPNICRKGEMPEYAPQRGGVVPPHGDAAPRMHGGARGRSDGGRRGMAARGGPVGPRDGMHGPPPPQQQPFVVHAAAGEPLGVPQQPQVMIVQQHQLAQMMPQAPGAGPPRQAQAMMQAPLQMAPYGQPPLQPYAMGGPPMGFRNGPYGQ